MWNQSCLNEHAGVIFGEWSQTRSGDLCLLTSNKPSPSTPNPNNQPTHPKHPPWPKQLVNFSCKISFFIDIAYRQILLSQLNINGIHLKYYKEEKRNTAFLMINVKAGKFIDKLNVWIKIYLDQCYKSTGVCLETYSRSNCSIRKIESGGWLVFEGGEEKSITEWGRRTRNIFVLIFSFCVRDLFLLSD